MTNSIPLSRLRELVEEWREQAHHVDSDATYEWSLLLDQCADQLEALMQEVESERD